MRASQIQMYKFLEMQYGVSEATQFLEYLQETILEKMEQKTLNMATKDDIMMLLEKANTHDLLLKQMVTRHELTEKIHTLRNELSEKINSVNKNIFLYGVLQFLAIVGSILAIIKFVITP